MKIGCRFLSGILMVLCTAYAFSMGGKIQKIPMKPYSVINIPDGEFLRYGYYVGGEKDSDTYLAIKRETNGNGELLYRIYKNEISITSGKKLSGNYTAWPSFSLIDPGRGSVMEWEESHDTNTQIYKNNESMFYPYYFQYQYYPDKGYVDEVIKSVKGSQTTSAKYRVKVNPDFSVWDQISFTFYGARFMDPRSGGILYMVAPFLLKEAAPVSFKYLATETIRTKAGTFRAHKINIAVADPFIGKLMGSMMKSSALWIEDSDRRLLIKSQFMGNDTVLEEISNMGLK